MVQRRGKRQGGDRPSSIRPERRALFEFGLDWPAGWAGFDLCWEDETGGDATEVLAAGFDAELQRELSAGHTVHGRPALAIAKREATDDVLFAFPSSDEVAVVHLTWQRAERPPWPRTTSYQTVGAFLAAALEDFGT